MRSFKILPVVAAGLSIASPLAPRATTPVVNDNVILNYVLSLEYLQEAFFTEGLRNFTQADFVGAGLPETFYDNLKMIYTEDQTQISFLVDYLTNLGVTLAQPMSYAFGVPDVKFFLTLLSVLEGVGLSAYLGSASSLCDKAGVKVLSSILAVQARHSSYIRGLIGQSPFPRAFETPIDFNEAFTLTSVFIVDSPANNTKFPFEISPYLELECANNYYEADVSSVTFQGAFATAMQNDPTITASTPMYAAFLSGLDQTFVPMQITQNNADYKIDKIPAMDAGQVYVVLTRSATLANAENRITGPAILQIYPKGMAPAGSPPPCL